MTITAYTAAWREWCAGADPEGWICDAIRFKFQDTSVISLANRLSAQPTMVLRHETGEDVEYTFCGFEVSLPIKTLTTEYSLELTMVPLKTAEAQGGGQRNINPLLSAISNLNSMALNQIVTVEHRVYMLPANPDGPAVIPAGKYYIGSITTGRGITVSCLPPNLNRKRAGFAYRLEEFSGLART